MGTPLLSRRRWVIAGMLMLLSVLNYVDRQAFSILAKTIQDDLGLDDIEYGRVVQAFLFCYAGAYLAAGRLVDRVGPRVAETLFVVWWSVANMLTGLARGFWSLVTFRCLLGLGEPGHYAVAAKAVGRHFPPAERGLAVSLYTMGGTLGAALAAPLVAWLTLRYGWRAAFVVTGAAGLAFAAVWWVVYRDPPAPAAAPAAPPEPDDDWHQLPPARPGSEEAGGTTAAPGPVPLREILGSKPLWLVVAVRALTDSVWYFYLVWFAKYLQERRDFSLADVGATVWVVFVGADLGCLAAGWAAGRLVRRGVPPVAARVRVMTACAAVLAFGFTVSLAPSGWAALALASLMAGGVMAFMTCAVALPIDLFPASSLGSVQGVVGTGGSLGGMVSTGLVAWAVTHYSYDAVFAGLSVLHPLAAVLLVFLLPRLLRDPPKP